MSAEYFTPARPHPYEFIAAIPCSQNIQGFHHKALLKALQYISFLSLPDLLLEDIVSPSLSSASFDDIPQPVRHHARKHTQNGKVKQLWSLHPQSLG